MTSLGRLLRTPAFLIHWAVLFVFWYALSGFDTHFYLAAGGLCAGAVAALTYEMQLSEPAPGRESVHFYRLPWHRIGLYALWLSKEIVLANWTVLKIVLDPRPPIAPAIIRFRTRLRSSVGRTILANSITLTPGTITVDVVGDELIVHALVGGEPAVQTIAAMQDRIARTLRAVEPEALP